MNDNTSERHECDVLIAGAGPVGQVLALLLAQQGLRVSIVERWAQPYPLPRAVAIAHDVLRVLRQLDLGEELSLLIEPWGHEGQRFSFVDSAGETLMESGYPLESDSGFGQMSGFSQPDLEELLEKRVRAEPRIEQFRGFSLEELSVDESGVTAGILPHTGTALIHNGRKRTVRAAFAVGCDGANSTVRSLLGVAMTDLGFDRDWLVVDVLPHTPPTWLPYASQRLGPARPTTLVPAGPGRRRWEFMIMPTDGQDDIDTDENVWLLLKPWEIHPGNAELVRHALYTFRARWADEWRSGRVVLAGDAAHQMPPFLGQGFNSGIRDAANLAWRLALLVNGKGKDSLLDYVTERRAQVSEIVEATVALGGVICMLDPEQTAERDVQLRSRGAQGTQQVITDWTLSGGTLRDDPVGGKLGLQATVGTPTRPALFDDVVPPPGFVLLGRDRDPAGLLSPAQRATWRQFGGRSVHFGPGGLTDAEGKYASWFDRLNTSVVLVRPDFQVFGGVLDPSATGELVDHLAAHVLA
jgi:2-polyprenyl-6-methoxyphenol hydroxylase-like FAD-dependent oxidoreductase